MHTHEIGNIYFILDFLNNIQVEEIFFKMYLFMNIKLNFDCKIRNISKMV